jgi:parvulin-like peptidyl-prolyl isomerase
LNIADSGRLLMLASVAALSLAVAAHAEDPAVKPAAEKPAPAAAEKPADNPADKPADTAKRPDFIVDAMVGQVNGHAIYASEVFKSIGEDTLRRVGEVEPRLVFKARASELIEGKLRERVTNALILAEAERGLGEKEMMGLLGYVKQQREKFLAEYGGGVLALTEERLQREKGHGLDEELEQFRQSVLVDKFKREKLLPKVSVSRRQVEHYYNDHFAEFNPSPSVTLRVIVVSSAGDADAVDKALAGGASFEEVAKEHSTLRADQGGLMPAYQLKTPIEEFNELKWKELNEKVRKLPVGKPSDRTKLDAGFGWVMVDKLEGNKTRSLQDAFLEIENRMRAQQFNRLFQHYMVDLLKNGNYTPMPQMGNALVEVAMVRYARPQ